MTNRLLSEDELIRIIRRTVKNRGRVRLGIGDDAAVLRNGTVITTDAYAEGVHFDLAYMTLSQVGERCACGAISDVVAMGAQPEAVFVALVLPRHRRLQISGCRLQNDGRRPAKGDWRGAVRQLYSGIESVCAEMGCEVAGGDTIVADRLLLALTVTGKTRTPRFRSGARPGDDLYVTGHLGSAEAGRMLLAEQAKGQKPRARGQGSRRCFAREDWRLPLASRHLRPVPRLAVMKRIKPSIHGLIDTSDGLATDARHLSEMSGVEIVLEADSLPFLPATERFCTEHGFDPIRFVLAAGEDHELLITSRRPVPSSVNGVKVTRIGRAQHGSGLRLEHADKILPVTVAGYDHLKANRCWKTCY